MNTVYLKVQELLSQYYTLFEQGRFDDERAYLGTELSNLSNKKEERYYIICSFRQRDGYGEIIYISYDRDLNILIDFANDLCLNKKLKSIEVGIYCTGGYVVCKSSPLGLIFI